MRTIWRNTPLLLSTCLCVVQSACADADAPLPTVQSTQLPPGQITQSGKDGGAALEAPPASQPQQVQSAAPQLAAPTEADHVPGELVIKFKSETTAAITQDVARCLRERRSFADITADGSNSLDAVLGRHGVTEAASLLLDREGISTDAARLQLRTRAALPARLRALQIPSAGASSNFSPLEGLVNVYRLRLPQGADLDAAMADLRQDPHVEYVHRNYVARTAYTPNDPYLASSGSWGQPGADLWDIEKIRAPQAWDASRGAGVVVAVVDTGVDTTHPDLAGNIWTNPGEIDGNGIDDDRNGYVDDVHGWSALYGNNHIEDEVGHGTHVAGTIAAQDNNGLGIVGVAPDAKIMPVHVFGARSSADSFTLSQGLVYATRTGADVINNSWEFCPKGCGPVPLVEDAVRAAHAAGSVVVFSAGNSAEDVSNHVPQNVAEAIVVTATTPSDTRAQFSNFGVVDIAAPGSGDPADPGVLQAERGILSLRAANCLVPRICSPDTEVGGGYVRLSGTSMAAPHVSGAAALVLALHPDYSPEQVRQVLRRTSVDANANGYDPDLGYGRLDVANLAAEPTPLEALIQIPAVVNTSLLTINGRASGSQFASYVLEYGAGTNPTTWTTLVTSTTPVAGGALYFWRTATLPDGDYTLRLRVTKTNGAVYEDRHRMNLDRVFLTSPTTAALVPGGNLTITGSAAPGNFKSYALRVQALETGTTINANLTVPGNGLQPMINGVLATWNTQGLAAGHYKIFLDVTTTSGALATESAIVLVDPLLHAGFPVDITYKDSFVNPPSGVLTVADLQNDGPQEVVTGWDDSVTVRRGDGSVLTGWPQAVVSPTEPSAKLAGSPVAGDIDGDGQKEVVAATNTGKVFVWAPSGALKPGWPRTIASNTLVLSLADVDRNGVLDVVGTDSQSGIHVLSGSGNKLWGWPVPLAGVTGPATVADLNRDGRNEVIVSVAGSPNKLYVLSSSGVLQAGWGNGFQTIGDHPVVGDMDDDGDLEIVAVASDGVNVSSSRVAIYHHNGQLLRSWSPNVVTVGPPVLGDVDGDGSLEVLASTQLIGGEGALYMWTANGSVPFGWPQLTPSSQSGAQFNFNTPILADMDADGRSEVIAARQNEFYSSELLMSYGYPVRVYAYNGASVSSLVRPVYGDWPFRDAALALADIDGDARLELMWMAVGGGSATDIRWPRVHAWDLTTPTTAARPWSSYRADARHSGVAQSVVPLVRLTQRDTPRRVTGLSRFVIRSGGGGMMQVKHPAGAKVQYAIGNNLLKYTTLGSGEQFNVPANQDVKLRIVTTQATDVTINWW